MTTITVRFRGICCFIDPKNGEGFKKRVIVPNMSSHQHDMEEHLTIVEFLRDDLLSARDLESGQALEQVAFTRPGDGGRYAYIKMTEPVRIEFVGTSAGKNAPKFDLDDATIHLDDLVGETLQLRSSLLGPAAKVRPALAKAVIDLPDGVLRAGSPDVNLTQFPPPAKFDQRRIARTIEHNVEVDGTFGLTIRSLVDTQKAPKEIRFASSTALITIANEPERLIVGHFVENQPASETADHFDAYWDLFSDPPFRPVPSPFQGTGPGCVPANKP
jgi:hypothetical protein